MKLFFAYALVVIGVPVFVGLLFGAIVSLPIVWLLRTTKMFNLKLLFFMEFFNGFGAVLAATLLFHLFGLQMGLVVLIIMATWVTLYFLSYKQSLQALFICLIGMLLAWYLIPQIFSLNA